MLDEFIRSLQSKRLCGAVSIYFSYSSFTFNKTCHHHHHHRLTAVLSRQTRVSRFPQYHPSPPNTVISIFNNKSNGFISILTVSIHVFLGLPLGFLPFTSMPSFHLSILSLNSLYFLQSIQGCQHTKAPMVVLP